MLSDFRASGINACKEGVLVIIVCRRVRDQRWPSFSVGNNASIGAGDSCAVQPIQFNASSVAPTCDDLMNTMYCAGSSSLSASMMPTKYGMRELRHGPASADDLSDSRR